MSGDVTLWGTVGYTFRKSEIVKKKDDFARILSGGKRFEGTMLSCFVLPDPDTDPQRTPCVKVGFALRRQFKRAVDRNRLKRLMREAYRLNKKIVVEYARESSKCLSMVFLYSPRHRTSSPLPSADAIVNDMEFLLHAIARQGL